MKAFTATRTAMLAMMALVFVLAGRAEATLVDVSFSGLVRGFDPALAGVVAVNDTYTGSFQYDNSVSPYSSDSQTGSFHAVTGFSFDIKSGALASSGFNQPANPASNITVQDGAGGGFYDAFDVNIKKPEISVPSINGFTFDSASLDLTDNLHTAITSTTVLPASLDLSQYLTGGTFNSVTLAFANPQNSNDLQVIVLSITSLTSTPGDPVVPEPATMTLIGLGCAGAGWLRRRKSRLL